MLTKDNSLKTGPNSWAEIDIDGYKSTIRVKEKTLVEFMHFAPVRISLLNGELRSLVEGLDKGTTFEIKTPTAVCGARGTGWDTKTDGKEVMVDTYEEEVYFQSQNKKIKGMIKSGKRGILKDPAQPIDIKDIPLDKIRDWNKWKDALLERKKGQKDKKDTQAKIQKIQKIEKTIDEVTKIEERSADRKDVKALKGKIIKDESGGQY